MSYQVKQVVGIVIAWTVIGLFITVYDHLVYLSHMSAGVVETYSFFKSLTINITVAVMAAIAGGGFLVYFVNERFRDISYYQSFLLILLSFALVSTTLVFIISSSLLILSSGYWSWEQLTPFVLDAGHIKNGLIWLVVLLLTQIALQVRDKFGAQVLKDLIMGRYHKPKEETRIFMFVDMISSTTIAERLGNEKYHLLLRDFYSDITRSIVRHSGEIYQYVGDEVVLSWRYHGASDHNDNCVRCFFSMTQEINLQAEKYLQRYGVVPEFKAGIHYGKVIAGEIGILKRDITFSGDVLNTTSRIQGKCNEFKVRLLASDDYISILPDTNNFTTVSLGFVLLRGKDKQLGISTLLVQENAMR